MTSSVLSVKPGAPQQLTGFLADNATIINLDNVNSVWISSNRSVSPNNGLLVEPGMSVGWNGGTVFACVDSGILALVKLNITDEVSSIFNPSTLASQILQQGLAQQIATDISNTGVPINNNWVTLANLGISVTSPSVPTQTAKFDVSNYASIAVTIQSELTPLSGTLCRVQVYWFDQNNNFVDIDEFTHVQPFTVSGVPATTMRIPVRGAQCQVLVYKLSGVGNTYVLYLYAGSTTTPNTILRNRNATSDSTLPWTSPPMLWNTGGITIPASSQLNGYIPPVSQAVRFCLDGSAAPAGTIVARLFGVAFDSLNNTSAFQLSLASLASLNPAGAGQPISQTTVNVPFGMSMFVTVTNNDTASHQPGCVIWDASDN